MARHEAPSGTSQTELNDKTCPPPDRHRCGRVVINRYSGGLQPLGRLVDAVGAEIGKATALEVPALAGNDLQQVYRPRITQAQAPRGRSPHPPRQDAEPFQPGDA